MIEFLDRLSFGEADIWGALVVFALVVATSELYLRLAEKQALKQIAKRWKPKACVIDVREQAICTWIAQRGYHRAYPKVRLGSVIKTRNSDPKLKYMLTQGKIDYLGVDENYMPKIAVLASPPDWKLELLLKTGIKVLLVGNDTAYEAQADTSFWLAPLLTPKEIALVQELEAEGFEVYPRLRLMDIVESDKREGELCRRVDLLVAERGKPLLVIWSTPLGYWPTVELKALGMATRRLRGAKRTLKG